MEYPSLEIRNEDRLAAEAVARTSGGLTAEIVKAQIRKLQELLPMIEAGLDAPVCPELTNANPSAPHTVILEAQAWLLAQMGYRINQIPPQNHIAFANLFGIEPRPATAAETILRFTVDAPNNTNVIVPAETQVSDADGKYIFETVQAITIPSGTTTGTATARRIVAGHTLLAPNVLTRLIDSPAMVESVTNLSAVDSGTETESLASTLERVKRFQRRGTRLVSAKDLEDAILGEVLNGNGIVRAFPFIGKDGFAANQIYRPGHTSVIVMTRTGDVVDAPTLQRINELLDERVGNQFVYIVNPYFVEFNVSVNVRLNVGSPSGAIIAAVEKNLRAFYAASREQFGRPILRSEIIAVIEGTSGVDRIEAVGADILTSPSSDLKLKNYELPKLVNVNIQNV